ncbi:ArsR/SmtB family transcription factor [Dictyobacter kobayashii]|uniref:HTH arsR-type domain-containing protein n=1 Tax=Dictyobacter kobayashii TaxID=2014872 RepID=A0A402AQR3_9CHLR|nr:winged helix-turn-helix domain-containing protein [Dictyobacter kobayashii]GCE21437.1 hypothetical protein KDK_52370 [Dictyobacter kobayashii]
MAPSDFQDCFCNFLKLLADRNRLKLLGLLANREQSVEELAAQLQLKAPTVSHHLARLKKPAWWRCGLKAIPTCTGLILSQSRP